MRRIVVIHTGAVGDLVQSLPALRAVREAYPRAEVTFVGRPERGALARLAGAAEACVDIETSGLWRLTAGDVAPPPCPPWLAEADLVLDFLTKGALGARLPAAARVVAIDPLPPDGWQMPAATYLAQQVRAALGLTGWEENVRGPYGPRDGAADVPVIPLDASALAAGRRVLASHGVGGGFVAIHPGSGSVRKNWAIERFEAIARRVRRESGTSVVWLAGPAEVERGTVPRGEGETVLTDLALTDVAAVLGLAKAYVGNDSGVTQVAAAVRVTAFDGTRSLTPAARCAALFEPRPAGRGDVRMAMRASRAESHVPACSRTRLGASRPGRTPVVALFGPTDPRVWAPQGEHVRVVRSADGTMNEITVEAAWSAVRAALAGRATAPG